MLIKINQAGAGWAAVILLMALTNGRAESDPLGGDPATVTRMASHFTPEEKTLRDRQLKQLEAFAAAKEKQAEKLAAIAGEKISEETARFFDAAKKSDYTTVRSMFSDFTKRHRQYKGSSGDKLLDTSYWAAELEVDLAYSCVAPIDPKSVQFFVDDTIQSIPPGSIYFGGTDSGRGLITAFTKSHADGNPFFTITQNALADATYIIYLRRMYGEKIHVPTDQDTARCYSNYLNNIEARLKHDKEHPEEPRQIKPGEDAKLVDGRVEVSGQFAVMQINGEIVKTIFDQNPTKEFYIEESFPLDWMYPYLEPHGPIFKLNRHELAELPQSVVSKDRKYWRTKVNEKLGDWLTPETPVATVAAFAEKVFAKKDLSGFMGDPRYLESVFSEKMTSKLRSSIGGLYAWRSKHAGSAAEKARMGKEADFAYRQAFALCPYSPEAIFGYVQLLVDTGRIDDATRVASVGAKIGSDDPGLLPLVEQLQQLKAKMPK